MKSNSSYTLVDLLKQSAENFSDMPAIALGNSILSYHELDYRSELLAAHLQYKGVKVNDHIAILSENCPDWGIAFFGIIKAGAIVVSLDVFQSEDEMSFALSNSGSVIVFTSETQHEKLAKVSKSIPGLKEIIKLNELLHLKPSEAKPVKINGDSLAILIYTSGTMGAQRGVMLSHRNLVSNTAGAYNSIPYTPGTSFLSLIPLSHMFGITAGFLSPLYKGAVVHYSKSLKGPDILQAMQQSKVEILVLVPIILKKFYTNIISQMEQGSIVKIIIVKTLFALSGSLRGTYLKPGKLLFRKIHQLFGGRIKFIICGGSPLAINIESFFDSIDIPVLNGYGLTETSPIVSVNTLVHRKYGSVGRAMPDVQVKFSGEGEILVNGPNVMKGYFKDDEASSEVLRKNWFHTGDIGEIDSDGFLFIKDRIKNVIVLNSGLKIFPNEIETEVAKSKFIQEVCVLKYKEQNEEQAYAIVVPDFDQLKGMNEESIKLKIRKELEHYQRNLPPYKKVLLFEIWKKELPKTSTKKIKRKLLENWLNKQTIEKNSKTKHPALTDAKDLELATIIKSFLNKTELEIEHSTNLNADLGIDSIMKVELICEAENKLGIVIPENLIWKIETFKDLAEIIASCSKTDKSPELQPHLNITNTKLPDQQTKKYSLSLPKRFISGLFILVLKLLFRIKVRNAENIPESGNFILAANHTSMLDFPLICSVLNKKIRRRISVPAAHDYFYRKSISSWLFRTGFNIIPLKRYGNYFDGLKTCSGILSGGNPLVVFPEGTRSLDGRLSPFRQGVGLIASETNSHIIPVYIKGAFEALPKGALLPKPGTIEIHFGKLVSPEYFKEKHTSEPKYILYQQITNSVRASIIALMNEAINQKK